MSRTEKARMERVGETRIMKSGLKATIVEYHNAKNVDVRLEDGQIVRNRTYANFINGSISGKSISYPAIRLGEARIMNNGLSATIIGYRTNKDIDIQFSNGEIVLNTQYKLFKNGIISCPLIVEEIEDYAKVTNVNTSPHCEFLIDIDDIPLLNSHGWSDSNGYVQGYRNKQRYLLHRLIMNAPPNMQVDHISGDKSDNRKRNLRLCTRTENQQNVKRSKDNTSGWKGVTWSKAENKWHARINANKKHYHLGFFVNAEDAAIAYNEAAIRLHGEFARLNKIDRRE